MGLLPHTSSVAYGLTTAVLPAGTRRAPCTLAHMGPHTRARARVFCLPILATSLPSFHAVVNKISFKQTSSRNRVFLNAHLSGCVNEFKATPHSSSSTYGLTTAISPAGTLRFQHAHVAIARAGTRMHVCTCFLFSGSCPVAPSFRVLWNKISFEANAVSKQCLFERVPVRSYLGLFLI